MKYRVIINILFVQVVQRAVMFSSGLLGASGGSHNPMKDFEVQQPPDDSISKIAFSSAVQTSNYLVASSWDNNVSFNS